MAKDSWKQTAALFVCIGLALCWSLYLRKDPEGGIKMTDFGEIYYGSRCVFQHQDPYDPGTVLKEFTAEGGKFPDGPIARKAIPIIIEIDVNLPTTLFLATPVAMLSWPVAQNVWAVLIALLLAVAASLTCDLAGDTAPAITACLAGFMLFNSERLLTLGNIAGFVIGLCVIAAWCFLRNRYTAAGVLLLAFSLVLKPHDSGFVWLYFLLAGGVLRKRALQTLAVAVAIGVLAAVWIAPSSPHWFQELHRNLTTVSLTGSTSDPTLAGITNKNGGQIIDLQAAVSIFARDPHIYNSISYLIGGSLILVWAFAALLGHSSPQRSLLALAAISALSILPVYHRPHDAKILLLTLPACALLWTQKGRLRWVALAITWAAVLLTSDIPLGLLLSHTGKMALSTSTLGGKLAILFLVEPTPLALFAMGCFYLWAFMSYKPAKALSRATLMRSCVLLCVVLGGLRALCAPPHLTVDEWPSSSWGCSWVGPGHFGVERAQIQARLERLPGKQLVFVRYLPGHEVDDEWVYNLSDIDDSKVIWARDMGAADDLKLLHYYRDRMAWFVEPDTTPATLTPYPGPAQTDAH